MDRQSRRNRAPAAEGLSEEQPVRRVGARRQYVERRQGRLSAAYNTRGRSRGRRRECWLRLRQGPEGQGHQEGRTPVSRRAMGGGDASERSSRKLKSNLLPKRQPPVSLAATKPARRRRSKTAPRRRRRNRAAEARAESRRPQGREA